MRFHGDLLRLLQVHFHPLSAIADGNECRQCGCGMACHDMPCHNMTWHAMPCHAVIRHLQYSDIYNFDITVRYHCCFVSVLGVLPMSCTRNDPSHIKRRRALHNLPAWLSTIALVWSGITCDASCLCHVAASDLYAPSCTSVGHINRAQWDAIGLCSVWAALLSIC